MAEENEASAPEPEPKDKVVTQEQLGHIVSRIRNDERARAEAQARAHEEQMEEVRKQNSELRDTVGDMLRMQQQDMSPEDRQASDLAAMRKRMETLEKQVKEKPAAQANPLNEAWQTVMFAYDADVNEFERETPDYHEALQYLRTQRRSELSDIFGVTDPKTVEDILIKDQMELTAGAKQQGKNAAEHIYRTAKLRGYKTKSNGAEELKMRDAGQQTSEISGGSAPPSNGTDWARMTREERNAFRSSNPEEAKRAFLAHAREQASLPPR